MSLALLEDCGDSLTGDGREYLRRVRAAAQRMGELIDDLLSLSRVARNPLRLEDDVDLSAMARDVVRGLREASPDRPVDVQIEPQLSARCDPRMLRIVLDNLLANAWKFTAKNPEARIRVARDGDGYSIADNGVGFDPTYAARLFSPFQRLHGPEEFEGTGIGLATVHRIIRRHGGDVTAHGVPERGATFRFSFGTPQETHDHDPAR
jgi:signal transduction histidine kinase